MTRRGLIASCALAVVVAAAVDAVVAQSLTPRGLEGFGGFCSHTTNCNAPHSVCRNMTCTCERGYEVNGTTCTIKLNSNCNTTHICNRTGAHCVYNVCICRFDYVLSANYQNCLPVATNLNQACEVQAQCREFINSTCSSGVCQCIPGHHYNVSSRSCERPGVETIQSTDVKQQSTHLPVRNKMPANYQGIGANCTNNANCTNTTTYSECRSGKCACIDGYEVNGTICVGKLNSTCNNNASCNRNGTICNSVTKRCECDSQNYVESFNGQACLKLANRPYDWCTENQQCKRVQNTACYSGVCACNSGAFLNSAGSKCEYIQCHQNMCDFMGYAICSQGYCSCRPGGVGISTFCYKQIGKVGEKCDAAKNERCYLTDDGVYQNVECKKGKCACIKPYKSNKAKTRCVSGASYAAISPFIFVLIAVVATLQT